MYKVKGDLSLAISAREKRNKNLLLSLSLVNVQLGLQLTDRLTEVEHFIAMAPVSFHLVLDKLRKASIETR